MIIKKVLMFLKADTNWNVTYYVETVKKCHLLNSTACCPTLHDLFNYLYRSHQQPSDTRRHHRYGATRSHTTDIADIMARGGLSEPASVWSSRDSTGIRATAGKFEKFMAANPEKTEKPKKPVWVREALEPWDVTRYENL